MTERLKELVTDYILGRDNGLADLSVRSGVSITTIEKVRKGHIPRPETARNLALACGLGQDDALVLAKACASKATDAA